MVLEVLIESGLLTFCEDGEVIEGRRNILFNGEVSFSEITLDHFANIIFQMFVDFSGSDDSYVRVMDKKGHFEYTVDRFSDDGSERYGVYSMYIKNLPEFAFESHKLFDR